MFQSADINNDGLMDEEESISLIKTLSDGVRQGSMDRRPSTFIIWTVQIQSIGIVHYPGPISS